MHSLNRGRTHEWNLKTKKQKHTGECCSHTNTNFATDIRFARNLNTEQLIRQWIVNSDENIAKLGWYYASSVIAAVFRPDNVSKCRVCINQYRWWKENRFTNVLSRTFWRRASWLCEGILVDTWKLKNHFRELRSGKVRGRFTGGTIPLQTTKKASVRFQFNLIKKWFYLGMERIFILFNNSPRILVRRQSLQTLDYTTEIGENGIFIFLTCSHI